MEIIFKVLWLDEISGEEGRAGEKSPRASTQPPPPTTTKVGVQRGRKGGRPDPGEEPGEQEQRFRREGAVSCQLLLGNQVR